MPFCWRMGSFSIFWKISPPLSFYYGPSLIKNFYKAMKATPFCAYDFTGRYSSVFFKLMPLSLIPEEYKEVIEYIKSTC